MTYDNFDRSLFQALISFDSCAKFVLGGGAATVAEGTQETPSSRLRTHDVTTSTP